MIFVRSTKTEKRLEKISRVVKSRQHSLTVVMENIHDPHNVSAIFRTCDAVGISKVSLIYTIESFPRIGKKSSASAFKWVDKEKYKSVEDCYAELRNNGYKIFASSLTEKSKNLYELDLTQKTAIVVGNEHRGVSETAAKLADEVFLIPQFGMVQSLNVSVATAVILYEALRQRLQKGMYDKSELDDNTLENLIDEWCLK
ncbi:MAG TPA: TrmH family RNA methyltransferase [Ignavibacteriaceae bacterium]|nr:TrmH family RNA methyltransferase [Ignavibacteriaceae bacterium]